MGPRFRIIPEVACGVNLRAEFELPSDLRFVGPTAGYFSRLARQHGFGEEVWAENLPLAMDEAVTNAMRHGNRLDPAKCVRVSGSIESDRLQIRVEDEGEGFDPDSLPDPRVGDSLFRPGGRGVFLIRNLCDEVRFELGGRAVVMAFLRHRP